MSEIIIRITVPEGATVNVEGARVASAYTPTRVTPLTVGEGGDRCPEHNVVWKHVPPGVSKKTGKPYNAFWACPELGCSHRPAFGWKPSAVPVQDIPSDDPFDWVDEAG